MCASGIAESVTLTTPFMGDFVIEEEGKGKRAIFVHGENETGDHMVRLGDFFASRKLRTVHFDLAGSGERSDEDAVYPFMHLEVCIIKHLRADGVMMYSVSDLDLERFCVRRDSKRPHYLEWYHQPCSHQVQSKPI